MIVLDDTSEKIDIVLGSSPFTELDFTSNYMVDDGSSLTAENNDGTTSGTTDVALVPSPGSGEQHLIKWIHIFNPSGNSAVDVTVKFDDGTNERTIVTRSLGADESMEYVDGEWRISFSTGKSAYTDEQAQDAVGNNFSTGLNYEDATPSYTLDETVLKDGGAKELDAADLAGAMGTDGQVLTSTGSAAQWEDVSGTTDTRVDIEDDGVSVVTDASIIDFRGGYFAVTNPTGSEVDVDLTNSSIENAKLVNESVTVAGKSVSLGNSITVALSDLSDASITTPSAGQTLLYHGTNSQFENADITDGTGINKTTGDASLTLSLDEAVIKDGGAKEIDASEFAGSNGANGEVLQTGGAAVSWGAVPTHVSRHESGGADEFDLANAASTATKTMVVSGGGMWSSTTNGATGPTQTEFTTNDVDLVEVEYTNSGTDEHAQVTTTMPDNYGGGTINARFLWRTPASAGTVVWGIQGISYANDDPIDTSWGTRQTVSDTAGSANNDMMKSSTSSAVTLAGSPSGGDLVQIRITRESGNASDDLSSSAFLIAVQIEYTESGYSH
jgi:hypothetical protein